MFVDPGRQEAQLPTCRGQAGAMDDVKQNDGTGRTGAKALLVARSSRPKSHTYRASGIVTSVLAIFDIFPPVDPENGREGDGSKRDGPSEGDSPTVKRRR